jgi:TetR/AcrR family transcriptional repressor of nem operon
MDHVSSRGRPRAFDESAAMAAIVETFWARGYEQTTYEALCEATGIGRQSLVYAFGGKREMFARALRAYGSEIVGRVCAALDASPGGRSGIEAAFGLWRDAAVEGKGCLMVSTAADAGASDPEIAALVQRSRDRLAACFAAAFDRAKSGGQLRSGLDAHALGALAVACGDGCLVHARKPGGAAFAERALSAFLGAVLIDPTSNIGERT